MYSELLFSYKYLKDNENLLFVHYKIYYLIDFFFHSLFLNFFILISIIKNNIYTRYTRDISNIFILRIISSN